MTDTAEFAEWAILELMGHRRVAGHVREVTLAGAGFLRLDIPETPGHDAQTQFVSPGSVYALHPTDEATARLAAASFRQAPEQRWELERAARVVDPWEAGEHDDDLDDEDDEGDGP